MPATDPTQTPENSTHKTREDAYKQGVHEAYGHNVVFIDPDKISMRRTGPPHRSLFQRREINPNSLERQMDRQVEGAADAFLSEMREKVSPEITMRDLAEAARSQREDGPAAINDIEINSSEHGIVYLPSRRLDTKEEVLRWFSDEEFDKGDLRTLIGNMPGTHEQWMRFIGNHEGAHLKPHAPSSNGLETLIEESRADRVATDLAKSRGEDHIALAFQDLRALTGHESGTHNTSALMDRPEDLVTFAHYYVVNNHRDYINLEIQNNIDWLTYPGDATNAEELLEEHPETYFAYAALHLHDAREKLETRHNNPMDLQAATINLQTLINAHEIYEDAYRRRIMGQDIPERELTQLISFEDERAYYVERELQDKIADQKTSIILEQTFGDEFSLDSVFETYDWSTHEGPETSLLQLPPEQLYTTAIELLEDGKQQALADHKNDPNYENTGRLVEYEIAINEYAQILHNEQHPNTLEAPIFEPIELLSAEDRREYFIERIARADRKAEIEAEIDPIIFDHYLETRHQYLIENTFETAEDEIAYLEELKQEAITAYNAEPSYENVGKMMEAQLLIYDRFDAINLSRMEAGNEASEHKPLDTEPFVDLEIQLEYYQERKARIDSQRATPESTPTNNDTPATPDAAEPDKGYLQGPDGTPLTTEVNGLKQGTPKVDFEHGITVDDIPINNVFGASADPSAETVSIQDPRVEHASKLNEIPPEVSTPSAQTTL